jgi:hypothetical protein
MPIAERPTARGRSRAGPRMRARERRAGRALDCPDSLCARRRLQTGPCPRSSRPDTTHGAACCSAFLGATRTNLRESERTGVAKCRTETENHLVDSPVQEAEGADVVSRMRATRVGQDAGAPALRRSRPGAPVVRSASQRRRSAAAVVSVFWLVLAISATPAAATLGGLRSTAEPGPATLDAPEFTLDRDSGLVWQLGGYGG